MLDVLCCYCVGGGGGAKQVFAYIVDLSGGCVVYGRNFARHETYTIMINIMFWVNLLCVVLLVNKF